MSDRKRAKPAMSAAKVFGLSMKEWAAIDAEQAVLLERAIARREFGVKALSKMDLRLQKASPLIREENLRPGSVYKELYDWILMLNPRNGNRCRSGACALVILHYLIDPGTVGYPPTNAARARHLGKRPENYRSAFYRQRSALLSQMGDRPEWMSVLSNRQP